MVPRRKKRGPPRGGVDTGGGWAQGNYHRVNRSQYGGGYGLRPAVVFWAPSGAMGADLNLVAPASAQAHALVRIACKTSGNQSSRISSCLDENHAVSYNTTLGTIAEKSAMKYV